MNIKRLLLIPALALALAASGEAQLVLDGIETLDFDRPESWAMKYAASAALQTGLGVPSALEPGAIELGFEAGWLPSLDEDERRVGFNGTKVEDIDRSAVFARPRLTLGLPAKLSLELGYVPPVELDGIEPNLASLALARPLVERRSWRLGARLNALQGTIEGDIVCTADEAAAGPNPALNPFLCEAASDDELDLTVYGVELSAAFRRPGSAFEPYLALAIQEMDLEFQIDARWSGIVDRTLQQTDGSTWYATLGLLYDGWRRSNLAFELFYTPLDVVRPPAADTRNDELLNARVAYRFKIR